MEVTMKMKSENELPAWMKDRVEIWKPVKGHPNYLVSNQGKIMNGRTGKQLKPYMASCGYLQVTLFENNGRFPLTVHQIVAETFVPKPKSDKRLVVHHIDGIRENNRHDNLMWLTYQQHCYHHGLPAIVSEEKKCKIAGRDKAGNVRIWDSVREARKYFNLSQDGITTALYCADCKLHTSDGNIWELWRVDEIRNGEGETTWKAKKPHTPTKSDRKAFAKFYNNKI